MRWILSAVATIALCVPNVASAQPTPEPGTVEFNAAADAYLAGQICEAKWNATEAEMVFVVFCGFTNIALDIAGNPKATIGEINQVDAWWADFDAERVAASTDWTDAITAKNSAKAYWDAAWNNWACGGNKTTTVLWFITCYAKCIAAGEAFDRASEHYSHCILDYASVVLLREELRTRADVIILP